MTSAYSLISDLGASVEPPDEGILTRTLYNGDDLKLVLFGFAAGEELSEHTASLPAVLHFLEGQATLTLEQDSIAAGPGTWVHMPPGMKHSIITQAPTVMVLLLLKTQPAK